MLAALTTRCLAQRTASVTALARTLGCAPKTLTELVDKAAEDNRSQTLSRIDAKLEPPDPNKPREVFRYDFKKAAISQIPVGRAGNPDDIANTASFLVSEGAGFVSGQVIYVAGGPRN